MATTYDTVFDYCYSQQTLIDKMKAIDATIDLLNAQMDKGALNSDVLEYQFNNGQSIVKTIFRDTSQIQSAIDMLEKRWHKYYNRLNGRAMRLRDRSTFNNHRHE